MKKNFVISALVVGYMYKLAPWPNATEFSKIGVTVLYCLLLWGILNEVEKAIKGARK